MVRCPYCKERIKKGAVRCKHCHSGISGNGFSAGNDDGVRYLQNGFGKISAECDTIENRIKGIIPQGLSTKLTRPASAAAPA